MWTIRINHQALNRYRVIKGETQYDAEQKAAFQMKAWNEQWERIQLAKARRNEQQQMARSKEERKHLADTQSAEAECLIASFEGLLSHGATKDNRIDWSRLKDSSTYPEPQTNKPAPPAAPALKEVPAEPQIKQFLPHLSWFARLIPPIRNKRNAEARASYNASFVAWRRSKIEIGQVNATEVERCHQLYDAALKQHESDLVKWYKRKAAWLLDQRNRNEVIDEKRAGYMRREPRLVSDYCEMVLNASEYPDLLPCAFELDYISDTRVLVVDYSLPPIEALPEVRGYRYVATKDAIVPIPVAESWLNKTYDSVLYQITLRTLFELFQSDDAGAIESIVFNGWVNSIDKATGKEVNACIVTVQANKAEFLDINLAQVEPHACFKKLKGISASKLTALSPVRPILQLNRDDTRFIPAHAVVDTLDSSTNLAAMDWEDFEHLIRELFEREFSSDGGEVKITQASRDGGVDAIVFDPDPIKGGKIVIQAKRYTNTVSVAAVRDLFGTILNEGANKGILVTTADYGPDAYEFAKGKPITLLSGNELLYLLQKHGHKARIDMVEAKLLAVELEKAKLRLSQ